MPAEPILTDGDESTMNERWIVREAGGGTPSHAGASGGVALDFPEERGPPGLGHRRMVLARSRSPASSLTPQYLVFSGQRDDFRAGPVFLGSPICGVAATGVPEG